MKATLLFFSILFSTTLFAQDPFFGLFSNSYLEQTWGAKDLKKINKPIFIIYNRNYCTFYVEGKGNTFFKTRGYQVGTQGEYIHTDFISEETNTTPDGYYGIMIDESKKETIFQVALPNGYTYLVNKAEKYSENGKVTGNLQIANQKKIFEKDIALIAERKKYWDTVTNVNFALNPTLKQKHLICNINISDYINDKLNLHTSEAKIVPIYKVHIYFNIDTAGKVSIQGRRLTENYMSTTIIEDLRGIDIDKKVKEIFMTIPWEIEKDFYGKRKEIYNCEVTVNVEARPAERK